jgi:hypothetical protein
MSLYTRLDKLEAAMRGRDGGGPPDGRWICRLIYDSREWEGEKDEAISGAERLLSEIDRERIYRMKTDELDRLAAAGKIRASDRERVRFIVRRIVQPPERPDLPEDAVGRC